MVDAYYKLSDAIPLECAIPGAFSSAMILVIDEIAKSRSEHLRARSTTSYSSAYSAFENQQDFEKCSTALERLEHCWKIAGKLRCVCHLIAVVTASNCISFY
jgi:hypothetical protein